MSVDTRQGLDLLNLKGFLEARGERLEDKTDLQALRHVCHPSPHEHSSTANKVRNREPWHLTFSLALDK